jgi:electron transfer flavoprotein alpha subunit
MEKILFLAHTDSAGTLPKAALEVLGGAMELAKSLGGTPLAVGLVGGDLQAAADSIAGCGAESFLAVSGDEFTVSCYATDAAAAEALVRKSEATLVIVPATSRFSRAMPGVAQRVDGRIDTHVTAVEVGAGAPQIERWYYRQRMVARLSRQQRPWFVLIDSGVFDAVEGMSGSAALENVAVEVPATRRG